MKTIIRNIKTELLIPAMITTLLCILILVIAEYMGVQTTLFEYNIEIFEDASQVLDVLFPLFVTLPFTWRFYYERKDGFIKYVSVRTDKRKYIIDKILSGAIVVFIMVFIIYYSGIIAAQFFNLPNDFEKSNGLYDYILGSFQAEKPLVFGLIWCSWKGFISIFFYIFGALLALLIDNVFVIMLVPFIYFNLENYITAILNLELYSIVTSFVLNRLDPQYMKLYHYSIGLLTFIAIASIIILILVYKKKQVYKDEKCN